MQAIDTQDNEFHDGNGTTELGTILPAWWLNQVQAELLAVMVAGGVSPDRNKRNQVAEAISTLLTAAAPSGMVVYFAGQTAPTGWLKANGAAVSRTLYANLFAAIGTTYGAGDGSTTFNLPDMRGEFIRGWDDGRGVDAGRVLGSAQSDAIRNITGSAAAYIHDADHATQGALSVTDKAQRGLVWQLNPANFGVLAKLNFNAAAAVPTAAENRPRNVAQLGIIKI